MSEAANLSLRQLSCIPEVHFDLIPIRNLVSNQDYQRMLSESHISKIIRDFDVYQINPVKVSRRNGQNYVFDGQHTIEVIASVSGSRDTPVWCMVYDDLQYQEEAHIFAEQQKHSKSLVPYEMFVAHMEAGDNKQMMIHQLVTGVYNLKISSTHAPGSICAVSALEYIYDRYGYEILDRTLRLALGTWEGENQSLSCGMLKGIAILVSAYGDNLNDEMFKDHVGRYSAKAITRNARDRRPGALGFAEALVIVYNGKNKKKLSLQKLYWSTGRKKGEAPPDFEMEY
ncbi:MAG: hypothetical protein IKG87_11260 [Clostridia bacterium]|nr:hypothetical protein [Clostridia bacterium]